MQGSDVSRDKNRTRHDALDRRRTRAETRRTLTVVQSPGTQDRLEGVFRAAPIGMGLLCNRRFTEFNDQFCRLTGYDREELVGRSARILYLTQEDYDHVETVEHGQIAQTGIGNVETRWKRKDGQVIDVLFSSSAINPADWSEGVTFTATDITERNRSQSELRESESRFRELFDHMSSGVAVYEAQDDGQDFVFRDFNRAAERIESTPRSSVLGRRVTEVFPGVEDFGLLDVLRRVWRTGRPEHHPVGIYRDNRVFGWRENYVYRLPSGEVVAVYDDVTDRERGQEALRESEEKYRGLVENSLVGIGISKGDQILYANQSLLHMYGYDDFHELAARPLVDYLTLQSRKTVEDLRRRRARGEDTPRVFEVDIVRKDGAIRTLQSCASYITLDDAVCVQTAFIDVTDRRRMIDALLQSEQQFRSLFDNSMNGVLLTAPDGRIIAANRAACRIFDRTQDELRQVGRSAIVDETDPRLAAALEIRARTGGFRGELTCLRKDGTKFPVELASTVFENKEGLLRTSMIIHDITERKKTEENMRVQQRKLRSLASELSLAEERERRRIAADLHDHACQSLATAKMKLDVLVEEIGAAHAAALQRICDDLSVTIDSIRDLTFDLSSATLYKFGLEAALEELLKDKLADQNNIEYQFVTDGQSKPLAPEVCVLLFQSVRELLINVVKHASARHVTVEVRRDDDCIEIVVADDGIGFDVDAMVSSAYRNRSVGLFFVRERLDYTGGTLRIDSRPGHGTRFMLTAPLDQRAESMKESQDGREDLARR